MTKLFLSLTFFFPTLACHAKILGDSTFSPKVNSPAFRVSHPILCIAHGHHNLAIDDGRYSPIIGLLKSDGYQIKPINSVFSLSSLKVCKILYTSAARSISRDHKEMNSSAFSVQEIVALKHWVNEGGGLLVATDHPNMAQASEALVEAFGVSGSQTTVKDAVNTIPELNDSGVIVFKVNPVEDEIGILKGRNKSEQIRKVTFFDGQSLASTKGVLLLPFQESAQEELSDHSIRKATGRAGVVVIRHGNGRVVITGDATVFTSKVESSTGQKLGINREGSDNVQFAINTFHWLSKLIGR